MARQSTANYADWPRARFSASSRPIPTSFEYRRTLAAEQRANPPSGPSRRTRVAQVVLPLVGVLALFASAPQSVTIPLAAVLLTAAGVNGALALVDRGAR